MQDEACAVAEAVGRGVGEMFRIGMSGMPFFSLSRCAGKLGGLSVCRNSTPTAHASASDTRSALSAAVSRWKGSGRRATRDSVVMRRAGPPDPGARSCAVDGAPRAARRAGPKRGGRVQRRPRRKESSHHREPTWSHEPTRRPLQLICARTGQLQPGPSRTISTHPRHPPSSPASWNFS